MRLNTSLLPATRPLRVIRSVAVFEGAKGLIVIATGFGLLALLHRDVQAIAEELVRHFHLNPANRYPQIFLTLAARVTDTALWLLAFAAAGYAAVRLAEAYGLWFDRNWASWLGALSGGIYVPIEVYELVEKPSLLRLGLLSANTAIVVYLGYRLWRRRTA